MNEYLENPYNHYLHLGFDFAALFADSAAYYQRITTNSNGMELHPELRYFRLSALEAAVSMCKPKPDKSDSEIKEVLVELRQKRDQLRENLDFVHLWGNG